MAGRSPACSVLMLAALCMAAGFQYVWADSEVTDTACRRYLVPALTSRTGASNQLIEFVSAAVIARILNRTLCVAPFTKGPNFHQLPGQDVVPDLGIHVGDRYNLSMLARFVPLASLEECMSADVCGGKLDIFYKLKRMRYEDSFQWESVANQTIERRELYRYWKNPSDVAALYGPDLRCCMGMGGLFPGLRWRGAFLAMGAFLQHTDMVIETAKKMRMLAFGSMESYVAVHWRFWEAGCHRHGVGLCFLRCTLGANPAAPEIPSLNPIWQNGSSCGGQESHYGVKVDLRDIAAAVLEVAERAKTTAVWLATDGWLREGGCNLIAQVVTELRRRNLRVAGLWRCDVPGFADTPTPDNIEIGKMMGLGPDQWALGNHMVSILEQEMCIQSAVFLGTGVSSWSVAVHRHRLAARRAEQLARERGWEGEKEGEEGEEERRRRDDLLVEDLLKDDYSAGVLCVQQREQAYHHFGRRERLEDDIDAWLDNMACEGREGKGGNCSLAICF